MEDAITEAIEERMSRAKEDGDLDQMTVRVIKEHLLSEMGEDAYNEVLENHKAFLKAEASRIFAKYNEEAPGQPCGVGGGEEGAKSKKPSPSRGDGERQHKKKEKRRVQQASSDEGEEDDGDDFEDKGRGGKRTDMSAAGGESSDDGDDFVASEKKPGKKCGAASKKKGGKRKSVESEDEVGDDDDDFEDAPRRKKRTTDDENTRPRERKEKKHTHKHEKKHRERKEEKPQRQPPSEEVERLKALAKKCGLVIGPNVYRNSPSNEELEERLGAFLLSSGLQSVHPKPSEISKVKAERTLAAELDGIDTSNIVSGRRKSGAPLAARPTYNWDSDSD